MTDYAYRYKWMRREIERLDPEIDAPRIIQLCLSRTLPRSAMVNNLVYTLGLVRLCASREQAIPLHRSGRGKVYRNGNQRADETNFHLFMWLEGDLSMQNIQDSLAHVRSLHQKIGKAWPMRQEAFVHALASFTILIDRLQTTVLKTTPLGPKERAAFLFQFTGIGQALDIGNIPETWEGMGRYLDTYEVSGQVGYSPEGVEVANALIEQFLNRWLPTQLHKYGRWGIVALLEEHIVSALHLPAPPAWFANSIRRTVKVWLALKRHVLPDARTLQNLSELTASDPKSTLPRCPVSR